MAHSQIGESNDDRQSLSDDDIEQLIKATIRAMGDVDACELPHRLRDRLRDRINDDAKVDEFIAKEIRSRR
ncbi:MAG: hypothetical protein GC152_11280 [Alphaproteobacteria bacterium]|nr:hypothetical protein [Alphaproteobacteria bacterium]